LRSCSTEAKKASISIWKTQALVSKGVVPVTPPPPLAIFSRHSFPLKENS
jgi:hypothetical protein